MASPATASASATTAGRGSKAAAFGTKGSLFGWFVQGSPQSTPTLGTMPVTLNSFTRSVGLPIMGNVTSFFQRMSGSRLGR